jgi:hypothetical protein
MNSKFAAYLLAFVLVLTGINYAQLQTPTEGIDRLNYAHYVRAN